MKKTFQVESDTGGVVLIDPALIPDLNEDVAQCLNVLFDPEGRTCAVLDYPDQKWSDVWREAAQCLNTFSGRERLLLTLACEGTTFVRVQDQPLTPEEEKNVQESFTGRICVSGKCLAVVDGMMFFDDSGISKAETVSLRAGCYSFTLYHMGRHSSEAPAVGLYGSDQWPGMIFVLQPAQEHPTTPPEPVPNLVRLNTAHWVMEPVADALCMATVTKVSDKFVTLELHLTNSTRSGNGRMRLPAKMSIKPNQVVVVHLETDEGAYWSAEFVSKA